jgi:hypothetical protein|tara:strand:+ start:617 stop:886 length:270 start_codon:yes stop_codon:yes gene_type:complete
MSYQKLQAGRASAVTPSDTVNIPSVSTDPGANRNNGCVLFVGGAGNIKVTTVGGDEVTFNGISSGTFIPVQVTKVHSTGTSATNIVALW